MKTLVFFENELASINRPGFVHIAFLVDDVEFYLNKTLEHGGRGIGRAGGLVGINTGNGAAISNSYAAGAVSGGGNLYGPSFFINVRF